MTPVVPPKNLEELVFWVPKYDNSSIPDLPSSYCGLPKRRRTLVCHDYAGGYGKDNSVVPLSYDNDYLFFHWQFCDIFVYFSHHLVTIPPDGWVCAAHRNTTPILGTLIAEGTDGSAICEEFLKDEKLGSLVANKLVEIAVHHKLQGWLINIESDLEKDSVQPLINWLKYLSQQVHDKIQHGMVIWYDSIVMSGSVQHQNELNANNIAFYEASDAIFLNYWWSEGELKNSLEAAGDALTEYSSNVKVRKTQHDIYVGVDVFGRKTFGGGQFTCNLAVSVCSFLDMSVAIFAPGWTHENASSTDFQHPDAFIRRDVKFWNLLAPLLPKPDANAIDIPFSTTFCNGIVFPKSLRLESDVDTGIVQTLKASMMYSLGETSMVPRCGPLFSYYLQHIAKNYNWNILDFNLAVPVEIFESSSDWIRLLHVAFTPRAKIKISMKYRFAFRSDISRYVPENIRAAFVLYSPSKSDPIAVDVQYGDLDSNLNLCECECDHGPSTGQLIGGIMIVLGNIPGTQISNFVPVKDEDSSSDGSKKEVASNETKKSKSSSMKLLHMNDCDIYCTLESSSCMVIVDKIDLS